MNSNVSKLKWTEKIVLKDTESGHSQYHIYKLYQNTGDGANTVYVEYYVCNSHDSTTLLLECKMRFFPEIWNLNMWSQLKFVSKARNWTMPNQIALNWTMQSQTKACITKSSCEICALLRYYTVYRGDSLPTFWGNLSIPSSMVNK